MPSTMRRRRRPGKPRPRSADSGVPDRPRQGGGGAGGGRAAVSGGSTRRARRPAEGGAGRSSARPPAGTARHGSTSGRRAARAARARAACGRPTVRTEGVAFVRRNHGHAMVHSRSVAANRYRGCADSGRRLPPAVAVRKVSGMPLTWLITGCSRGLGRALAEAVAASGDRLVATARDPDTLADLFNRYPDRVLAVALDVTERERSVAAVEAAVAGLRAARRRRQHRALRERGPDRGRRRG